MVGSERKSRPCFKPRPPRRWTRSIPISSRSASSGCWWILRFSLGVEKSARFGSRDVPSLSARWWAMITGGARVWKGETSADSANVVAGFWVTGDKISKDSNLDIVDRCVWGWAAWCQRLNVTELSNLRNIFFREVDICERRSCQYIYILYIYLYIYVYVYILIYIYIYIRVSFSVGVVPIGEVGGVWPVIFNERFQVPGHSGVVPVTYATRSRAFPGQVTPSTFAPGHSRTYFTIHLALS